MSNSNITTRKRRKALGNKSSKPAEKKAPVSVDDFTNILVDRLIEKGQISAVTKHGVADHGDEGIRTRLVSAMRGVVRVFQDTIVEVLADRGAITLPQLIKLSIDVEEGEINAIPTGRLRKTLSEHTDGTFD